MIVAVEAVSLNFRDLAVIKGQFGPLPPTPLTPLSDMAGRVVAKGAAVSRFAIGDRVAGAFLQDWLDGPITAAAQASSLFLPRDGVLAERVRVPEHALVSVPDHLSSVEASTLPIASVTAWNALQAGSLQPGDWVLVQGTGGVSIFALQLAKALSARVIVTSSSDGKLERARELGADAVINYRQDAAWPETARRIAGGAGVNLVVEVGGTETFAPSIQALALNGVVSSVGFLTGLKVTLDLYAALIGKSATLKGMRVGSRADFEALNEMLSEHKIKPVIDTVFGFDQAREALQHLEAGKHFGKVVISLNS